MNQNQNQNHLFDKKYIHIEADSCNCYSSHQETKTKEKTISANVVATKSSLLPFENVIIPIIPLCSKLREGSIDSKTKLTLKR